MSIFFPLLALFVIVCVAKAPGQLVYKETKVMNAGTIHGQVRLQGDASGIAKMQITKDEAYCGTMRLSPRLQVGGGRGVKNAVIFLEGITQGKKVTGSIKPSVNQSKCEYLPHVTIAPVGAQLEIVNSDPILHNVHAYEGEARVKTIFNIAQPIRGQRTSIKQMQLSKPGLVVLTCDAGHPWMSAYIVVAEHPYFVVSDSKGNFLLNEVPPGSYKIKMWHEGILVTSEQLEKGKVSRYFFENPYEVVKEVTVPANGGVKVDFDMTLRQ